MATVQASITLKKQSLPANPPASGNIRYQLKQGGVVKGLSVVGMPPSMGSFGDVPDGSGYTIEAQRISMANTPMGDSVESAPFDVVTMAEVDVPDVITVTL